MATRAAALLLIGLCAGGCVDGGPTYHDDVAPVLERSCMPCHAGTEPSRISLATYGGVASHAPLVRWAMASGVMPPGNVDRSGRCGSYVGPRPPSADEVALFARWVETGMHEGSPRAQGAVAPSSEGDSLPSPLAGDPAAPAAEVVTAAIPEPYLPAPDEHRCFLVDPSLPAAGFLTAFEVRPTAPEEVHHVLLFSLPADEDLARARTLDAEDARPGWSCFGSPRVPGANLVGVWAPGGARVELPPGTGLRIEARPLVVQVHYHVHDAVPRPDRTAIALSIASAVDRPLRLQPFAATGFSLPPGDPDVRYRSVGALPFATDVLLYGVFPHMHTLGKSLRLQSLARGPDAEAAGAAETACIVDAPRWDYGRQELAFYQTPRRVRAGEPLELTCVWSTIGREDTTVFGEDTDDEMCMVFLLVGSIDQESI